MQFRAQILSIDRGDDVCNDVERGIDGDVEPADGEQAAGETAVSNVVLLDTCVHC